jgi:hypothetical protein
VRSVEASSVEVENVSVNRSSAPVAVRYPGIKISSQANHGGAKNGGAKIFR